MRLTFVVDTFTAGGKERRCLQLIQGLNSRGIKDIQFIIINNGIEYPELFETSVKIVVLNRKELGKSNYKTFWELRDGIKSFAPNIVVGWGAMSLFFLNLIKLTLPFRYIAAHVANTNKPRGKERIIMTGVNFLADAIVGNSKAGLRIYKARPSKAYCFYNGFNSKRLAKAEGIDKESVKKDLGISTKYLVTMAARVDQWKDHRCFIDVAQQILSIRDDVTFLSIGKGIYLDIYQKETYNNPRILFLGFREDVEKILSISDISVLCSNISFHGEGVSNTIVESMAFGVPVVATKSGGTPEIVEDGINGFCIENNEVSAFSQKIDLLLSQPDFRKNMASQCKATIKNRFTIEKSINDYISLFESLLRKK